MKLQAFTRASAVLDLEAVHELRPADDGALFTPETAYLICTQPDQRGLCSHHIIVAARHLAPILFPEAK